MKRLLIVWHSHTGGSEQMARAAADAARAMGEGAARAQDSPEPVDLVRVAGEGSTRALRALGAADSARATGEAAIRAHHRPGVDDAGPDQGVEVQLLHAHDATADDVLAADGYLLVTPENLATMAGLMKDFFDRIYYSVLDKTNGRPYASLICAGSDGTGAARQIERIATGLRWKAIAPALIVITQAQTPEAILAPKTIHADDLARCAEIGAGLAAGLAAGVF